MNPLLFGHNTEERIVGVQPLDDATMRLWVRTGEGVHSVDESFYPFLFLSDRALLDGFPGSTGSRNLMVPSTTSTSPRSKSGPPCGTPSATSWTPTTAQP